MFAVGLALLLVAVGLALVFSESDRKALYILAGSALIGGAFLCTVSLLIWLWRNMP